MKTKTKKKYDQLGMSYGTAANKLRKMIMFELIQSQGTDVCHQCGKKIESVDVLSIEHMEPWLDSEDPVGKFFDLTNIAFSHLSCNSSSARYTGPKRQTDTDGNVKCTKCGLMKHRSEFHKNKTDATGVNSWCKCCRSKK